MSTIKTWQERQSCDKFGPWSAKYMQAEIDELRTALQTSEQVQQQHAGTVLWQAGRIAEVLDENTKLREALKHLAETHAWVAFGECRAFGTDKLLTSAEADKLARAALGEKP